MLRAAFIVLLIALLPSHARAEAKIALLNGNQGYSTAVGTLKNPFNDIARGRRCIIEARLRGSATDQGCQVQRNSRRVSRRRRGGNTCSG
jgi:hypothetical protein